MSLRLAHIVNPYVTGNVDEARIQQLTLSCMRRAKAETKNASVQLLSAQFPEDHNAVPEDFTKCADLSRSLLDLVPGAKKLPLLQDILASLKNIDADYFVYTNMDIAPMPYFYSAVAQLIENEKHDALIINRRRLRADLLQANPELLFAECGLPHPGYDCFVFKRSLLEKFDFGNAAIGVPGIGFLFAHNLFLVADSCKVYSEKHLTFHLGLEIIRPWAAANVVAFQHREIKAFLQRHKAEFRIEKFPGYHLPFFRRQFTWLMNPLFHYPTMLRLDLPKWFDGRKTIRPVKGESRWQEWKVRRFSI